MVTLWLFLQKRMDFSFSAQILCLGCHRSGNQTAQRRYLTLSAMGAACGWLGLSQDPGPDNSMLWLEGELEGKAQEMGLHLRHVH